MAELSCHVSEISIDVDWYKEKPDGSLHWIYQSSNDSQTKGKYSGKTKEQRDFSLAISPVQREDSGVYYCSSSISSIFQPSFGNGTRLVVTSECPAGRPVSGDIPGEVCAPPALFFPL